MGWLSQPPLSGVQPKFWITDGQGCYFLLEMRKHLLTQFSGWSKTLNSASESVRRAIEKCAKNGFGRALLKRCGEFTRN